MARRIDRHRDWSLLPIIILTGLLVGGAFGFAIKVFGPSLAAITSNPPRSSK